MERLRRKLQLGKSFLEGFHKDLVGALALNDGYRGLRQDFQV